MSAAIASLAASYGSGSGSESDSDSEGGRCQLPAADSLMHLTKSASAKPSLAVAVDSAPEVAVKVSAFAFLRCGNWLQLQNLAALVRPWVASSSLLRGKLLTLLYLFFPHAFSLGEVGGRKFRTDLHCSPLLPLAIRKQVGRRSEI